MWVEALLDYDNYRAGNTTQSVSCVAEGGSCKWIPLDVSFKQNQYKNTYRMLLRNVNFDYDAYYNAENPASPSYQAGLKDKSPLEIFEEQALTYLRTNNPGVTLEDVIDEGIVVKDESGLLPASMPFEVVGSIARYDSIQDHDVADIVDWTKYLQSQMLIPNCTGITLPTYTITLAELSTKQLTLTLFRSGTSTILGHRLDGQPVGSQFTAGSITFICNDGVIHLGTRRADEYRLRNGCGTG